MPSKSVRKKLRTASAEPSSASFEPSQLKPVGLLGGGQLARMLALEAHRFGLPVRVLSEKADDPAAQVASWRQGRLNDEAALRALLNECSSVTFESEFLDAEVLARLSKEVGTPIYPAPHLMGLIQDRLTQKELLNKNRLPTADFFPVANRAEAEAAFEALGGRAVFKKRRFGYDGYGTFVARDKAGLAAAIDAVEASAQASADGFIAERFVPFRRELAVMLARGRDGQVQRLPFVETFQENSRCLWVKGPLASSPSLLRLGRSLEKFLATIDYVGAIGVEFFETREGLLINELAPRVHNSGHYSMDALTVNQFELHMAAVAGLPLAKPNLLNKGFAMWNLLGSSSEPARLAPPAEGRLHWYGKSENRAGRKMGHLNTVAVTSAKAWSTAKKIRSTIDV